jgi:hypothetical protein
MFIKQYEKTRFEVIFYWDELKYFQKHDYTVNDLKKW